MENQLLLQKFGVDFQKDRVDFDQERALYDGLLETAEEELNEYRRRIEEAESEEHRLRLRVQALEMQVQARGGIEDANCSPPDLDHLKEWAEANIAKSVVITYKALRGAKDSDYEDPALVYQTLLLLRDFYAPMRREGGVERTEWYHCELRRLGLTKYAQASRLVEAASRAKSMWCATMEENVALIGTLRRVIRASRDIASDCISSGMMRRKRR